MPLAREAEDACVALSMISTPMPRNARSSAAGQPAEPGEVIFVDDARLAHARRWTNRQSGASAVRDTTTTALIVAEALHDTAVSDLRALHVALANALEAVSSRTPLTAVLSQSNPRFTVKAGPPAPA